MRQYLSNKRTKQQDAYVWPATTEWVVMCQMAIFMFYIFESKFHAIYNGENRFQIRGLVAELHVFEMVGRHLALFF